MTSTRPICCLALSYMFMTDLIPSDHLMHRGWPVHLRPDHSKFMVEASIVPTPSYSQTCVSSPLMSSVYPKEAQFLKLLPL